MKNNLIKRLTKIKAEEHGFTSKYWKDIYFAEHDSPTKHISDIDFETLNSDDLLRIFEYLILARNNVSENRMDEMFVDGTIIFK